MLKGAIDKFIAQVCADGIAAPEVVVDSKAEAGYFAEAGALFLTPSGTMDEVARAVLSYLFSIGRELPPDVQRAALNVIIPHLTIPCPGSAKSRDDGRPMCKGSLTFVRTCPSCYRTIT